MSNRFFPNYPKYCVTSPFGPRGSGYHYGIDLVAMRENGTTAMDTILAHTGGTVEACGFDNAAGYYVRIRVSERTVMSYCHFCQRLAWEKGDKIEKGTPLGFMGSTGTANGAHLHWGIKRDGKWINPKPFLDADYSEDAAEAVTAPESPARQVCTVTLPVLRQGDRGGTVAAMQALLALRGFPCDNGGADGIFGSGTGTALEAFQGANQLKVDAVCGRDSWSCLLGV